MKESKNISPVELMFYAAYILGYSFCMVMFIIYVDRLPVVLLYLWYFTIVLSCLMVVGRILWVEFKMSFKLKKGDFEWEDKQKSKVKFVEKEDGRFEIKLTGKS